MHMTPKTILRCCVLLATVACSGSTGPSPQDALYTVIVNRSPDSAFVVLKNYAAGPVLRQQTVQPGDSTCWVSSIAADSAFYNVGVWVADSLWYPFARGIGQGGFTIRSDGLQITRTWLVTIASGGPPPTATITGLLSGPGC